MPIQALSKLRWRLNRLRLMAPAEILWRCRRALQALLEEAGHGLLHSAVLAMPATCHREQAGACACSDARIKACPLATNHIDNNRDDVADPPAQRRARLRRHARAGTDGATEGQATGKPWLAELPMQFDRPAYLHRAARSATGRYDVFALRNVFLGFPPPWNRDPKTGTVAPLCFGKRLDYRDVALVGDIKYLWEPNRHYELVGLAQAYHLSKSHHWLDACGRLLESWFDACPYPRGQAWSSALENAVRLVNWVFAWHLLGGAASPLFAGTGGARLRQRWLFCGQQHCHFIAGHLSLYSSANNHLMGEYMGLFIAALTWPQWPSSAHWRALGHGGIEREALLQNGSDGVNREQAIWYHQEVAEMLLLCGLFGRANAQPLSPDCWHRLERMLEFIAQAMDVAGNVPMIGDADDATLRLSCRPDDNPWQALLASGAILFGRADFAAKAGRFDDKSRWLLGDAAAMVFATLGNNRQANSAPRQAARRCFPQGGYYVLGCDFDTPSEIRLVADAGPLGYLGIAAHGHADALAFTLSVAGLPMLIDPGTYAYHSEPEWRNYFRGTAAHNTVRIDGLDQSVIGGNFMWTHKANAFCEQWHCTAQEDRLVAHQDGYLRLPDPVLHRRRIVVQKARKHILVEDTFECCCTHAVELSWHFSDQCRVHPCGSGAFVTRDRVRLHIGMPQAEAGPTLAIGRTSPPLGWVSHRFDEKTAAPTLVWKMTIAGTVTCTTRLAIFIS